MRKFFAVACCLLIIGFFGTAFATENSVSSQVQQGQQTTITGDNINSKSIGSFPESGNISYPQLPNLFVMLPNGANIRSALSLIRFNSTWRRDELENIVGDFCPDATGSPIDGAWRENKKPDDTITVILSLPVAGVYMKGPVEFKGAAGDPSLKGFAKFALKAMDMGKGGSNYLYLETEGVSKTLFTKSWGIMLGGSASQINGNSAQVGTGGIGVAGGEAGYHSAPYYHGISFQSIEGAKIVTVAEQAAKKAAANKEASDIAKKGVVK